MRSLLFVCATLLGCSGAPTATPEGPMSPKTMQPPVAKQVPKTLEIHGHQRQDPYFWMRDDDRNDPEILAHLRAETAYAKAVMADTEALQKTLFEELKGRIKKDDSSVPVLHRGYWSYTRFETKKEYPIYCRRRGEMTADEEVLLDVNALAEGKDYYRVAQVAISENQDLLAFTEDPVSRRQYTVKIKNLKTGEIYPDAVPNTSGDIAWAADNKTIFYVKKHPTTLRPYQVYRHALGTPTTDDVLVHEEKDETFYVSIHRSKSRKYVMIDLDSTLISERLYLDAATPEGTFKPVLPREPNHEYQVWHKGDAFYIRTNWQATNFRLMKAPVATSSDRETWTEVIPHRDDVWIGGVALFDTHFVVEQRKNGLKGLRITQWSDNQSYDMTFDEAVYVAELDHDNPEFSAKSVRFRYSSLITPETIVEYNFADRSRKILKQDEVLGGFDSKNYVTERQMITARDGVKVPVSLVYRRGTPKDGTAPMYQYAYGSYGYSMDPSFRSSWISLLDRGFVVSIAHVRGGQEMGRSWYDNGKMFNKMNTFTDFIDVTEGLIKLGYSAPDRIIAGGGSAGGMLMGGVANMRPELYAAIYAAVPFVDVVTTMLDETIPLTTGEFDEWGNPKNKDSYYYMLSYSPYDNVKAQAYPNMIVITGLHDSQVQYWEPAKWVARLREKKTDKNLLIFDVDMDVGHGGASGRFKRFKKTALVYAFFLKVLEPVLKKK